MQKKLLIISILSSWAKVDQKLSWAQSCSISGMSGWDLLTVCGDIWIFHFGSSAWNCPARDAQSLQELLQAYPLHLPVWQNPGWCCARTPESQWQSGAWAVSQCGTASPGPLGWWSLPLLQERCCSLETPLSFWGFFQFTPVLCATKQFWLSLENALAD